MSAADELLTIRDWLRYGVSAFNDAKLVFGHGTDNALDEAAFLILSALHLPIDTLDPWLDCRLAQSERVRVRDLIAARIATRKPAAYLTQTAYIQGRKFYVDERVIVPRSFIGELICQDSLAAVVTDADAISSVLDLCTGSGCLAILAAEAFPNASVDASDISSDALAVARRNVDDYDLAARVQLIQSDLFSMLPTRRYDLIISNPPYVTEASVATFAAEYQSEPLLAHLGGPDGLDLVRVILKHARDYLAPNGILVIEIGAGRDALEAAYPSLPFIWLDTETSEGEVFALTAEDLAAS
ncbi:MAG: 50S ribosomal protein L3 N(5)-glutamine methyltransferase [Hyphomicrobium sp.]|nr:MAG: 50S ribosomal protein L3 N(5)-glutamine methyltransferase [Hyphomicrobium sp.]PPD00807.1 MAG: 50S ribosomal protein L3 N(5)-glutamine methyltransferase [Hyphomicrobium sp.]